MRTTASLRHAHELLHEPRSSRVRTPGSVLRQHAVTEVEDCRPPARPREHVERLAPRRAPTGRAARPGRGCPARRVLRRRRPAASSGSASRGRSRRRRRARARAAALGRAGAEVDRRHVDRGEDARGVRRDELLVVGGRERADPRVEELDHVGAGRAPARRRSARTAPRAAPSARARRRARRYISAFVRAKSRLGLPSTR